MSAKPALLIRADAAPRMGTGHVMRCLALAQWATREGFPIRLISQVSVPWVAEKLRNAGITFTLLPDDVPSAEDPPTLLKQLGPATPAAWVVLDGYHFGLDCQKAVRDAGFKLLLIDDYAHLPEYSCDILLNQNLGAEKLPYKGDIDERLFGPKYALLRPEFSEARKRAEERIFPNTPQKLLLTLGGGNFSEQLRRISPCFMLPEMTGRTLRVIAGAMPEETIRECLASCPAEIEILSRVDDIPALLLDTDLCITAGGSTCWELCCLGVPFLTLAVAENQQGIVAELAALGAVPASPAELQQTLGAVFAQKSLCKRTTSIVNGLGARRILHAIAQPSRLLYPAGPEDSESLWRLASSPEVRAVSLSTGTIPWETHERWFAARLQDSVPFFTARDTAGAFLGYVRFTQEDEKTAVISIALVTKARGRGLGRRILREACRQFWRVYPTITLRAFILANNIASRNAFTSAGFQQTGEWTSDSRRFLLFTARYGG